MTANATENSTDTPQLYLASGSPRRAELLIQAGIAFERVKVEVDEALLPGEDAADYVQRLAQAKADAGWQQVLTRGLAPLPVLGADTAVVLDRQILGKPVDRADGLRMLAALSGRRHRVMTAVCLCAGDFRQTALSISEVQLRALSPGECERYWETGEPVDKAGSYAIQGRAAVFVEELHGSYTGVVGLPLLETCGLLENYRQNYRKNYRQSSRQDYSRNCNQNHSAITEPRE